MAKTEYAPTTTPQKVNPSEERTSSGSASAVMGDSDDGCAGDDGVDCDDDVREDGGSSVRDDSALHPRSKHEQERAVWKSSKKSRNRPLARCWLHGLLSACLANSTKVIRHPWLQLRSEERRF
jgi:hypothetical protein